MHKGSILSIATAEISAILLGQIYADMRFLVTRKAWRKNSVLVYYNCSAGTYHSSLV